MPDANHTGFGSLLAGRLRAYTRWIGGKALDLALPARCIACLAPVKDHGALCSDCWNATEFITTPYCEHLGTPFSVDVGTGMLSARAMAQPLRAKRVRAVARYAGTARELVHALKYGDRLELARPMALMMQRAGAELLKDADFLLPVPLHPFRLWRRQFNQASELARELERHCAVPVLFKGLRRRKATRSQVGLNGKQRTLNVRGAFSIPRSMQEHIRGKRIVLIDDVMTTGATVNAAAHALLEAGALQVDVLTFALVFERV